MNAQTYFFLGPLVYIISYQSNDTLHHQLPIISDSLETGPLGLFWEISEALILLLLGMFFGPL